MVRKSRVLTINRPEAMPTLVFERFNPDGGNSEEAVVYLPEKKLLLHKGRHYAAPHNTIPEDAEIQDLFQHDGDKCLILKLKHSTIPPPFQQQNCQYVAMPDAEQQAKLTMVYQKHGLNVAQVAKQMTANFKQMKKLHMDLHTKVNEICPGYEPFSGLSEGFQNYIEDDDDTTVFPLDGSEELDEMNDTVKAILKGALALAKAEPFSRKRSREPSSPADE
jgi:hypothetical protein